MEIKNLSIKDWKLLAKITKLNNIKELVIKYDEPLVFTRDTLDGFREARLNYEERGQAYQGNNYLIFNKVQATKGQQLQDLYIIDCGEFRVVSAL
tara:strand:- start:221 stop:505 length:285 start_codon:yes stop_codon:yes gene_type:complete